MARKLDASAKRKTRINGSCFAPTLSSFVLTCTSGKFNATNCSLLSNTNVSLGKQTFSCGLKDAQAINSSSSDRQ